MLSFSGTTAPDYVREAVRERRVAGVILFGGTSPGRVSCASSPVPCGARAAPDRRRSIRRADRCGGFRGRGRSQLAGAVAEEPCARCAAAARQLRAGGVTATLAPVADVPSVAAPHSPAAPSRRDPRGGERRQCAPQCPAGDPVESPRPRSSSRHRRRAGEHRRRDRPSVARAPRSMPSTSAVRRGDRGGYPARDGRARSVSGVRPLAASPRSRSRSSRAFCARSWLSRRRRHRLDGGAASLATGSITKVSDARFAPARICCC